MRLFIIVFMLLFGIASYCDADAGTVETRAKIDALPKSATVDSNKIANEKYNHGERPWLIEKSSGEMVASDIFRAITIPSQKVLHVEYVEEGYNQSLDILISDCILMTTKGPCNITPVGDIICPE